MCIGFANCTAIVTVEGVCTIFPNFLSKFPNSLSTYKTKAILKHGISVDLYVVATLAHIIHIKDPCISYDSA